MIKRHRKTVVAYFKARCEITTSVLYNVG